MSQLKDSFLLGVEEDCLAEPSNNKETKQNGGNWELDAQKVPARKTLLESEGWNLLKHLEDGNSWRKSDSRVCHVDSKIKSGS